MSTACLPDVNVIVASMRADHSHHAPAIAFLRQCVEDGRRIVVPVDVLASALRVLMAPVWREPETSASAASLITAWLAAADAEVVPHAPRTWQILRELARSLRLSRSTTPDALLAASAIAASVTLATFDRGFARYPGLRQELLTG